MNSTQVTGVVAVVMLFVIAILLARISNNLEAWKKEVK